MVSKKMSTQIHVTIDCSNNTNDTKTLQILRKVANLIFESSIYLQQHEQEGKDYNNYFSNFQEVQILIQI